MNLEIVQKKIDNFIFHFDEITKENLSKKSEWQLDDLIKSINNKIAGLSFTEKVSWLTENNKNPYRLLAINLKRDIDNKIELNSVITTIEYMTNGKFLDSIGVPNNSIYSDLIIDLTDYLNIEKIRAANNR